MAHGANHHYVPQFLFRLFNGGQQRIAMLLTANGQIIPNASVEGQCSGQNFYGSAEIEKAFSDLEALHSAAFRAVIEAACSNDKSRLTDTEFVQLLQGVAFQRARTLLEIEKEASAAEAMALDWLKESVRSNVKAPADQRIRIIEAIKLDDVQCTQNPVAAVLQHIDVALESAGLLCDLGICILRNRTDYPFIFSDSPVVFYNSYYSNVRQRGVLGFQTPGLQVFMPLSSHIQLMLLDSEVYSGRYHDNLFCDLVTRCDVSNLNALQLHHSNNAVYFADAAAADYVGQLWHAHHHRLVKPEVELREIRNAIVDGKPTPYTVLHWMEPQINHQLSLSFVSCSPIAESEFRFRHRCPELVEDHKRNHPEA